MERSSISTRELVIAALLCAIGIAIPMWSPFKIMLEPASFTLASHVPIVIAMFISPQVAGMVAIGTTMGFLLGGFPIVIVMRAFTHVIFAVMGGAYISKHKNILNNIVQFAFLVFWLSIIHAVAELFVVSIFYFSVSVSELYYSQLFLQNVIGLVGLGTFVHSVIDFYIASIVWRAVVKRF